MASKLINGKTYEQWIVEYGNAFKEFPPYLYMQGLSDEEQVALLKKAIERGYPLDQDKDFGPEPEDADTIY